MHAVMVGLCDDQSAGVFSQQVEGLEMHISIFTPLTRQHSGSAQALGGSTSTHPSLHFANRQTLATQNCRETFTVQPSAEPINKGCRSAGASPVYRRPALHALQMQIPAKHFRKIFLITCIQVQSLESLDDVTMCMCFLVWDNTVCACRLR
jgi:hypothetical protein